MKRLRIEAVLRKTFRTLTNREFLLRGALGWWFVTLAAYAAAYFVRESDNEDVWAEIIELLVSTTCVMAVAINTHRFILLGETPESVPRPASQQWHYFLRTLYVTWPAIAVLIALGAAILALGVGFGGSNFAAVVLVVLFATLILPRSLVLPALAIGRRDFTIHQSIESSGGNLFRLFLIFGVPGAAVALCELAIVATISIVTSPTLASAIKRVIVEPTSEIACAIIGAAALSCCFAGLADDNREYVIDSQERQT